MGTDTLFSELVFMLSGADKSSAEFAEFFDLVSDCIDNPTDSTKKAIAFATAQVLAAERLDILDGSIIEDQSWAGPRHGYECIMADVNADSDYAGYSLWYHAEEDIIVFQHNFFEE